MSIRYTANTGTENECAIIFTTAQQVRDAITKDGDGFDGFICKVTNLDGTEYDALDEEDIYYMSKRMQIEKVERIKAEGDVNNG